MRFDEATISSYAPTTKVVIVCHEADRDEVYSIVGAYASVNWETAGEVRVLEAGTRIRFRTKGYAGPTREIKQDPEALQRKLDEIAPPAEGARILTVGKVDVEVQSSSIDLRTRIPIPSTASLRGALPTLLSQAQLDWMTITANTLGHYHHEPITRDAIAEWRMQFAKPQCGWIGDALLKLLDFWPSSKVCDHLLRSVHMSSEEQQKWLNAYDAIAFNEARSGDSSAIVCRFAKKLFGSLVEDRRVDFATYFANGTPSGRVLFLEDCLMTGSEIIKLFKRIPVDALRQAEIDLHFATGTAFGQQRLQMHLDREKLPNVRICVPSAGFLPNLTTVGTSAVQSGQLLDEHFELARPEYVMDGINVRAAKLFNDDERKRMLRFCTRVGEPLMRAHLERKGWSADRINALMPEWGLGPSGLGLLTTFAHGVPKPALPLLWLGGDIDVKLEGHRYVRGRWKPLFGRAAIVAPANSAS